MRVRICVAVDDLNGWAAARGWEVSASEEEIGDRWSLMMAAADMNNEVNPESEPTRFVWLEAEIPEPLSPEEAEIIEIHKAKQRRSAP